LKLVKAMTRAPKLNKPPQDKLTKNSNIFG
jgi:hypothetical protein